MWVNKKVSNILFCDQKIKLLKCTSIFLFVPTGNHTEVYKNQHKLAVYFQKTGDKWLSDHFFNACLSTSSRVKDDEGRLAAQGHCNVGLALEESGEYYSAADNFELFLGLCKDKDWNMDGQDEQMMPVACTHLWRIYTTIAKQFEKTGNLQQNLTYLEKAYDMAEQGNLK